MKIEIELLQEGYFGEEELGFFYEFEFNGESYVGCDHIEDVDVEDKVQYIEDYITNNLQDFISKPSFNELPIVLFNCFDSLFHSENLCYFLELEEFKEVYQEEDLNNVYKAIKKFHLEDVIEVCPLDLCKEGEPVVSCYGDFQTMFNYF